MYIVLLSLEYICIYIYIYIYTHITYSSIRILKLSHPPAGASLAPKGENNST